MKITDIKTFLTHDPDRPERNYTFVKVYTDEGLTGWAGVTGICQAASLQMLARTSKSTLPPEIRMPTERVSAGRYRIVDRDAAKFHDAIFSPEGNKLYGINSNGIIRTWGLRSDDNDSGP